MGVAWTERRNSPNQAQGSSLIHHYCQGHPHRRADTHHIRLPHSQRQGRPSKLVSITRHTHLKLGQHPSPMKQTHGPFVIQEPTVPIVSSSLHSCDGRWNHTGRRSDSLENPHTLVVPSPVDATTLRAGGGRQTHATPPECHHKAISSLASALHHGTFSKYALPASCIRLTTTTTDLRRREPTPKTLSR